MKLEKQAGSVSEIWQVFVRDSSSTTGAGLAGLTNLSSSLTAYYHRDTDTTATVINLVSMTVGTFTSSGFKEIDATNMPGWYQFCPPNAAIASGAKSCAFHLKGATNMAPLPIEVQLVAVNPDDATAYGLSRLDAAITTRMATYTQPTGFLAATFPTGTVANTTNITGATGIDVTKWLGGAIPAVNVTGVPLVDLKYTLGTLSPAAAGSVAIDWAQVSNKTSTVALTNTTVGTATTVTNQLTAAQIATGIWQDATAGDFTAANSIGKSVMNGVALGTGLTVNDITTKTGYSLSGTQTYNNTGTWTGNIVGTLSTLTTYTGNTPQTGDAYAALTGAQAEPGQGAPAVNASPIIKVSYLYKAFRNKVDQTATTYKLYADDNSTVDQKATVSDDGTTFSRTKIATGP